MNGQNERVERFRAHHPRFCYRRFEATHTGEGVAFRFEFATAPDLLFTPELVIHGIERAAWEACPPAVRNNLAFHLGMAEIASYWKATCSPEIVIEAAPLDTAQRAWWGDLLLNGMTEFYFVNDIDFTIPEFVTIRAAEGTPPPAGRDEREHPPRRVLVPVGGGKDSVVTIEALRHHPLEIGCLSLNPMPAARDIVRLSGCQQSGRDIVVSRAIDRRLLHLNEQGYLNGHTPFSSVVSFVSVACAVLAGYGRVALSYERSSNEGNVWRFGQEINHQYSKTFAFERAFRAYAATYLARGVEFFSFLRPLYEVQIARLFARMKAYHPYFRSCNRGLKTNSWCGDCPKCLFVYAVLSPFLPPQEMQHIFGADLFAREELVPLALQLLLPDEQKPFECVGTREETQVVFSLCLEQARARGKSPPPLLRAVEPHLPPAPDERAARAAALLASWDEQHALPAEMAAWLRAEVERR